MPPGRLPEVFQALVADPWAGIKHTGIMYNYADWECLRIPQENLEVVI